MTVKMKALRTFASTEGFIKRGQTFEVEGLKRAMELGEKGLADMIESPLQLDSIKEEEKAHNQADSERIDPPYDEPPEKGERWGVEALGGGWYELPCGERVQGFEEAKKRLYENLETNFQKHEDASSSGSLGEVRLIEPVDEPEFVEPKIVFTEARSSSEETSRAELKETFEKEVEYLGGGWYELPNKERVQGKESAFDLFRTYKREGEEA